MNKDSRVKSSAIGLGLLTCLLFAGIADWSGSKKAERASFDPRTRNAPTQGISPLDACYSGYIPDDAVIFTRDGVYVLDWNREFKKVRNGD